MPLAINQLDAVEISPSDGGSHANPTTLFLAHDGVIKNMPQRFQALLHKQGWRTEMRSPVISMEGQVMESREVIQSQIRNSDWFFFIPPFLSNGNPDWLWMLGYAEATKWRNHIVMVPIMGSGKQKPGSEYFAHFSHLDWGERDALFLFSPNGKSRQLVPTANQDA